MLGQIGVPDNEIYIPATNLLPDHAIFQQQSRCLYLIYGLFTLLWRQSISRVSSFCWHVIKFSIRKMGNTEVYKYVIIRITEVLFYLIGVGTIIAFIRYHKL